MVRKEPNPKMIKSADWVISGDFGSSWVILVILGDFGRLCVILGDLGHFG